MTSKRRSIVIAIGILSVIPLGCGPLRAPSHKSAEAGSAANNTQSATPDTKTTRPSPTPSLVPSPAPTVVPMPSPSPEVPDHCPLSFKTSGYCASLIWQSTPSDQGPMSFTLQFWNVAGGSSQGPYADPPGAVIVKLWMPSMGHGSSPITLSHSQNSNGNAVPGVFLGTDAYFIMPGDWDVHVQLLNGTQVSEEAVVSLKI